MDYDDFDDDYIEDDFGEDFENGLEMMEDDSAQDIERDEHFEEPVESGISFEDFLFWGGFMGMMTDEEREERRRMKKIEKEILQTDRDKKEKDYY